MSIKGMETIRMFDHNQISVVVIPGHINRLLIRTGKDYSPLPCCINGCAEFVHEFHAGMRVALAIGGGTIAVSNIDKRVVRQVNGTREEKMTVGDAVVGCGGVTGDLCGSRGKGEGGRG